MLMVFRLLAGLGLGGATPCFIALTSEYAPARLRAAIVTLMWSAFPFGGMIGGLLNSYLLTQMGWQAIFYIGGVVPLVIAVLLFFYLPESIKFLLTRRNDTDADPQNSCALSFTAGPSRTRISLLRRSSSRERRSGICSVMAERWARCFCGCRFSWASGVLTVVTLWTPALLRLNGISPANTAFVIAFNGLGAFIGQSTAGRLMERFGILLVLFPAFLLGTAATVGLGYGASSVALAAMFIGLVGLFMGLGTAGAIALSALIYPTPIRSTGVGWGMAMGRFRPDCRSAYCRRALGRGLDGG